MITHSEFYKLISKIVYNDLFSHEVYTSFNWFTYQQWHWTYEQNMILSGKIFGEIK